MIGSPTSGRVKASRWQIAAETEGALSSSEYVFSFLGLVSYRLNRAWDLSLAYSSFQRLIDTDELYNETEYDVHQLAVSRY